MQFTYNTKDVSPYLTDVSFERDNDTHDVTTFGSTAHSYIAGLVDGKITLNGLWDKTTLVGTQTVFNAAIGGTAAGYAFIYGPEGSTTGNVKYSGTAVVESYSESAPVADIVKVSVTLRISGAVTTGVY